MSNLSIDDIRRIKRMPTYARRLERAGLGDEASDLLARVTEKAAEFQVRHKDLIDRWASAIGEDTKKIIENALAKLVHDDFRLEVIPMTGKEYYQIAADRTDPVNAVIIAVRDDMLDTLRMMGQRIDIQKTVAEVQAIRREQAPIIGKIAPGLPGLPTIPSPEIPWYVWAGGGLIALVVLSSMLGGRR